MRARKACIAITQATKRADTNGLQWATGSSEEDPAAAQSLRDSVGDVSGGDNADVAAARTGSAPTSAADLARNTHR